MEHENEPQSPKTRRAFSWMMVLTCLGGLIALLAIVYYMGGPKDQPMPTTDEIKTTSPGIERGTHDNQGNKDSPITGKTRTN